MMNTVLPLVLDGLLVVLLLATIVYAMILNRKLNRLRGNHDEMEVFVDKLNVACARAEAASLNTDLPFSPALRSPAVAASKAEALRDELAFLVERADIVAGRLANASEGTSVVQTNAGVAAAGPRPDPAKKPAAKRPGTPVRRGPEPSRATSSGRGEPASDHAGSAPRSEAEEELLKALRNAR